MSNTLKVRFTIFFIALLGVGALIYAGYSEKIEDNPKEDNKKGVVTTYRSTIKNNPYSQHVAIGKALTANAFDNREQIENAYRQGLLVKVKNSRGVIIDELTHSKPYLHKTSAEILKEIGRDFHKKTSGGRIIVTSLTRPIEKQRELTRKNINASPNTSSHSYGVSFDIAYTRFNRDGKYNHDAHRAIEEILKKYQADGRILVIRETQSACYHITATGK